MSETDPQDLGNDVIATVNALMDTIEPPDPDENPMGAMMDPKEMVEMFKPQLYQKVLNNPTETLEAVAVINQATSDVLDKHAEESVEELASRGIRGD